MMCMIGQFIIVCGTVKFCSVKLLNAESMGRYYNARIKGNFDCRVNRMPSHLP